VNLLVLNLCNFYKRFRYIKGIEDLGGYKELKLTVYPGIPLEIFDHIHTFIFTVNFVANILAFHGFQKVLQILKTTFKFQKFQILGR
jgi:hypothetical protein